MKNPHAPRVTPRTAFLCSSAAVFASCGVAVAVPRPQVLDGAVITLVESEEEGEDRLLPTVGDITGDGLIDLLDWRQGSDRLRVLPSVSRGVWGDPIDAFVLPEPARRFYDVAAADVNDDGHTDIAYWALGINNAFRFAGVLLGRGDGTFDAGPLLDISGLDLDLQGSVPASTTIAVGEVTGDGVPDIVLGSGSLVVFPGDGTGALGAPIVFGDRIDCVDLVDIDGDGVEEAVFADNFSLGAAKIEKGMWELFGSEPLSQATFDAVRCAPRPDGLPGARVYVTERFVGDLGFVTAVDFTETFESNRLPYYATRALSGEIHIADVLGGPTEDVITDAEILVDPTPIGWAEVVLTPAENATSIVVADADLDGNPDIVRATPIGVGAAEVVGTGATRAIRGFADALVPGLDLSNTGIATGDFDGDGLSDLFTGSSLDPTSVVIYQDADGMFDTRVVQPTAPSPRVHVADVDADGLDDVLMLTTGVRVQVNFAEPGRTFAPRRGFDIGASPWAIATGDVDGDGDLDIVAQIRQAPAGDVSLIGNIVVLRQTAPREFERSFVSGDVGSLLGLAVGDMNGDGLADAVFSSPGDPNGPDGVSSFGVALSNGDGTFAAPTYHGASDFELEAVELADLDNDGDLDVVQSGFSGGNRTFVFENLAGAGDAFAQVATFEPVFDFAQPQDVVAVDMNADGFPDLVVGADPGRVEVFYGDGAMGFTRGVALLTGTPSPVLNQIAVGDLNADGFPDLAVPMVTDSGTAVVAGGARISFNTLTPQTVCPADLAAPAGLLDLQDIVAFVTAFQNGDPAADIGQVFGLLDLQDIVAFVQVFMDGCE